MFMYENYGSLIKRFSQGMCEKRCVGKTKSESKQKTDSHELVVQSWSKLKEKENRSDNVRNGPTRSEHRYRSNDCRNGNEDSRSGLSYRRNCSNDSKAKSSNF